MIDKNYISAELENKMSVNENPFPFAYIEGLLPTEIAKKAEIEFLEFNKLEKLETKDIKIQKLYLMNLKTCLAQLKILFLFCIQNNLCIF